TLGTGGKKEKKEETPHPFGATGIPPEMRRRGESDGKPVAPGGNQPGKPVMPFISDDDLVFTDPDAPDATIPELSTLLAAPKRGPWESSETIARQRSGREGKPLLIWFTDSQRSPMCKALSEELFSTHEFGDWAGDKIVRLKIDAKPDDELLAKTATIDEKEALRLNMLGYSAKLKKRYKVMGYPSLIMINTSGEVVGRYRGYKRGDAQFLWGQLKHAEAVAAESYKGWRKGLEQKGYREWQDRKGRKIFAKLTSYSDGTLTFIEPDGTRSKTNESKLSSQDLAWIDEQKKIRNIQ
ncbi:MAG: thioredoxin family protein, partial [Verrucomicrobiaceae bacterium]